MNYLRLAGALLGVVLAAISIYTDRGDPIYGLVTAAAFILSTMLHMPDEVNR